MNLKRIIIVILFLTSTTYYYQITSPNSSLQFNRVTRIIDGDTIQLDNFQRIRFLGINTPEKNQPFYQEAKDALTHIVTNKTIQIESHGQDRYGRTLAYVILKKQNINAQLLQQGLATLFYYDHDIHYEELKQSEEFARNNNLGLWKKSPDSHCIKIKEFKTDEPESLTLKNICDFPLNLTYKDDATHIYKTTIKPHETYRKSFSHIWNTNGDSIYIYDTKGLLTFYRYP